MLTNNTRVGTCNHWVVIPIRADDNEIRIVTPLGYKRIQLRRMDTRGSLYRGLNYFT